MMMFSKKLKKMELLNLKLKLKEDYRLYWIVN